MRRTALEESERIARARQGDARTYEALVLPYQELAFRTAWLITGDAQAAEDAVQEALVKAYYALPHFHQGAPFRPWLLRIVANEARNRRKAEARRLALAERAAAVVPLQAAASPETEVLRAEQRRALLAALARLSEEDRLVICARYFLSLSELEMAATMDCARGTVKSRLARALKRLRLELDRPELDRPVPQEQGAPQDGRSARHG